MSEFQSASVVYSVLCNRLRNRMELNVKKRCSKFKNVYWQRNTLKEYLEQGR
jgi:hypothetical protein